MESLEHIDKGARRLGGQECLDDPAISAPITAYAGEIMRRATGGRWTIRNPGSKNGWQAGDQSRGGERCGNAGPAPRQLRQA
jgi:hypothetical protein